jgi:hypothetical protein
LNLGRFGENSLIRPSGCNGIQPLAKVHALRHIRGDREQSAFVLPNLPVMLGPRLARSRKIARQHDRQCGFLRRSPLGQDLVQQNVLARHGVLRSERHCFPRLFELGGDEVFL